MLVHEHGVAVRRACQAVRLSRAAYYRPPRSRLLRDSAGVTALNDVVGRHSRWRVWKCFHRLRLDNGPELTAEAFVEWCAAQGIHRVHPAREAGSERVHRTVQSHVSRRVLDAYLFDSLDQVRAITEEWLATYNTERPHDSLGRVPPLTFMPRPDAPAESTFAVST